MPSAPARLLPLTLSRLFSPVKIVCISCLVRTVLSTRYPSMICIPPFAPVDVYNGIPAASKDSTPLLIVRLETSKLDIHLLRRNCRHSLSPMGSRWETDSRGRGAGSCNKAGVRRHDKRCEIIISMLLSEPYRGENAHFHFEQDDRFLG